MLIVFVGKEGGKGEDVKRWIRMEEGWIDSCISIDAKSIPELLLDLNRKFRISELNPASASIAGSLRTPLRMLSKPFLSNSIKWGFNKCLLNLKMFYYILMF